MNKICLLLLLALTCACSKHSDITGPYVKADFKERYRDGIPPSLDSIFTKTTITEDEKDAMIFLYAYMPLADVLNYDASFHLANVRSTLKTAEEMPWGEKIPDREFRHFVLPVRVNNEDLDMSRPIFYEELKDRVKNLSMQQAILEINHWCHEKATYMASDSRTNSPLATVCAARGRCGEESTLLVAALRSVGIPARQIYTPRWAHTDDNHAWVEAWADGRWRFLGACEPEAVLDLGWFNDAASRGMIMSTRVFGNYDGHEEVLAKSNLYTTINVTANYAATSPVRVLVTDENGTPVEGANVSFSIYNYAEFYPAITMQTDKDGMAEIHAGIGDMIVWVNKGDKFQVKLANSRKQCHVKLDMDASTADSRDFDIVPPLAYNSLPKVDAASQDNNNRRKAAEDSMRIAYENSFFTTDQAIDLAIKLDTYPSKIIPIMANARGNWPTVEAFLLENKGNADKAVTLLENLRPKDLNDITKESLDDHFSTPDADSDLYGPYILSPRISNERITPYKQFLSKKLSPVCPTPDRLIKWMLDSLKIDSLWNSPRMPISPRGVWKAKKADTHSRDIFSVAAARSLGFASRIDPVTSSVQYHNGENWINVNFSDGVPHRPAMGRIQLSADADDLRPQVKYYTYFTLSKIEDGVPHLLEYPEDFTIDSFASPREIAAGQYMLVTGQRLANGGVMARASFFTIEPEKTAKVKFDIRHDPKKISVIGSFDSNNVFLPLGADNPVTILSETGRGYFIVGFIDPRSEPSVHALNDICADAKQIDNAGRKIILLMSEDAAKTFDPSAYPGLPKAVTFGIDTENTIYSIECSGNLTPRSDALPIFIIADTFNRALWVSQGYNIGIGEQILGILKSLNSN